MSFPRYPRYKESGVEWLGQIPDDWEVVPVGKVATVLNGYPFDSALFDPSEGHALIRIRDLNCRIPEAFYRGEFVESASITSEDLLIGMDGDFNVGRWRGHGPALLNQRVCCIRGNRPEITRFLEYALPIPLGLINELAYSTTVKHLSSFQVEKARIAIPIRDGLAQVLAFLDQEIGMIDLLIEEQRRLIELLTEKRQAVISHAVTKGLNPDAPMKPSGIDWIGDIPVHWQAVPLKWLTDPSRPIMYGIVLPGPDVGEGVPILKGGNVKPSRMNLDSMARTTQEIEAPYARARLREGDLVYSIRGSIGDCESVPGALNGSNITQDVARVAIAEGVHPRWARWALLAQPVREALASGSLGAAVRGINIFDLKRVQIPTPPLSEQIEIALRIEQEVNSVERLIAEADRAVKLLQERRSALISAAVTGKIDVRQAVLEPVA